MNVKEGSTISSYFESTYEFSQVILVYMEFKKSYYSLIET